MPRTDEAEWWFNAVYETIQRIPPGKVTSYGHIAVLLGERILPPPLPTSQHINPNTTSRACAI